MSIEKIYIDNFNKMNANKITDAKEISASFSQINIEELYNSSS